MKKNANSPSQGRRAFLRKAAVSGGAAAAMAGAPMAALSAQADSEAQPGEEKGYRLTQHIIDYYKSAAE
jgi:uncharacterized membrane protein